MGQVQQADGGDPVRGPLPNFLVVGAAKSGTTSLWRYLRQHPQVFLAAIKEPNYFAFPGVEPPLKGPAPPAVLRDRLHRDTVTDWEGYCSLFAGSGAHPARGEASVRYLYYPEVPARIAAALPEVRVVMVLRDPAERVHSHYVMNVGWQLEPLSLADALDAEDDRVGAGWGWDWHYVRVSEYASQVRRYVEALGAERVLVVEHADLRRRPVAVYSRICEHIGVDPTFVPDTSLRAKESYVPRSARFDRALRAAGGARALVRSALPQRVHRALAGAVRRANEAPIPPLDPQLRQRLQAHFRRDVVELEELLGRHLPGLRGDA